MTTKEKILRLIERLDNNITYDQILYHIEVMKEIEARLEQADQGPWLDHDEVFDELMEQRK